MADEDYESILSDSLKFLGGSPVVEDSIICYGPVQVTVAPKEGKANTLLADHLFSPAIYLSERIERGLIDEAGRTTIELGAGAALPSLLMCTLPSPPLLVVVTDYPDPVILGNLSQNVERNRSVVTEGCLLKCHGYEWGTDVQHLLNLLPDDSDGFDTIILSDLLHFHDSHSDLVNSIISLLSKTSAAKVHVSAGSYTKPSVCEHFLVLAEKSGLLFKEILPKGNEDAEWMGKMNVSQLDRDALRTRKAACRYWLGQWMDSI